MVRFPFSVVRIPARTDLRPDQRVLHRYPPTPYGPLVRTPQGRILGGEPPGQDRRAGQPNSRGGTEKLHEVVRAPVARALPRAAHGGAARVWRRFPGTGPGRRLAERLGERGGAYEGLGRGPGGLDRPAVSHAAHLQYARRVGVGAGRLQPDDEFSQWPRLFHHQRIGSPRPGWCPGRRGDAVHRQPGDRQFGKRHNGA